jgi:hypothetical protein
MAAGPSAPQVVVNFPIAAHLVSEADLSSGDVFKVPDLSAEPCEASIGTHKS